MRGVVACYLKVVVRETLLEIKIRNVFVLNCKLFVLYHVWLYCPNVPLFTYPHYADMYILSRSCSAHFITIRCLILSYYLHFILITRKYFDI